MIFNYNAKFATKQEESQTEIHVCKILYNNTIINLPILAYLGVRIDIEVNG